MTPKIKIYGPVLPGRKVYLMESQPEPATGHSPAPAVTTDKHLASKMYPDPIGEIIAGPSVKLNALAEKALASLE